MQDRIFTFIINYPSLQWVALTVKVFLKDCCPEGLVVVETWQLKIIPKYHFTAPTGPIVHLLELGL